MYNECYKILIDCFNDCLNYDNIIINDGSNCFNHFDNNINGFEVLKEIVRLDLNLIELDINYIIYEYYKRVYYNFDLSIYKNCYNYKSGKVEVEKVKKLIIDNDLNIDII